MNRNLYALGLLAVLATVGLTLPAATAQTTPNPARLGASARMVSDQQRAIIETRAREVAEALFQRLCPGRCELVDLNVVMKNPRPIAGVTPGFESVTGGTYDVEPQSITTTILLDSKLPRNFRSNIPRMLQYRLQELAPVVNVRPEVLNFPEPQLQPMPPLMPEPPRPGYQTPPPMEATPEPQPAAIPAQPEPAQQAAEQGAGRDFVRTIIEALAPWLGPILLLLLGFALLFPLIRRLKERSATPDEVTAGVPAGPMTTGQQNQTDSDIDKLRAELMASRAIQNRVLRRWIQEDQESVANLVQLLGPAILADLKNDIALRSQLETISELVARQHEPLGDQERRRLANETQARLTAARIIHQDQALAMDWEFLEGLGANNLRRIIDGCTTAETIYVINQLPPALRSTYLETLDNSERRELFLNSGAAVLSKQEAVALATRLRKAADEVSHIGREAAGQASLVIEMLRALALDDQEEMLRELKSSRDEVAQAVLERVCLDTTVLHVPSELVADAIHRTPVETLVSFLRGTRDEVRSRILEIAPPSKRGPLMTEISLEVPVGKSEFLQARQMFTDTLRDILRREGYDIARANARALMSASKLNPVTSEASL